MFTTLALVTPLSPAERIGRPHWQCHCCSNWACVGSIARPPFLIAWMRLATARTPTRRRSMRHFSAQHGAAKRLARGVGNAASCIRALQHRDQRPGHARVLLFFPVKCRGPKSSTRCSTTASDRAQQAGLPRELGGRGGAAVAGRRGASATPPWPMPPRAEAPHTSRTRHLPELPA